MKPVIHRSAKYCSMPHKLDLIVKREYKVLSLLLQTADSLQTRIKQFSSRESACEKFHLSNQEKNSGNWFVIFKQILIYTTSKFKNLCDKITN